MGLLESKLHVFLCHIFLVIMLQMNIIKQNIKFKFNFLSIWDWNVSEVQFIVCHVPKFKSNFLKLNVVERNCTIINCNRFKLKILKKFRHKITQVKHKFWFKYILATWINDINFSFQTKNVCHKMNLRKSYKHEPHAIKRLINNLYKIP